MNYYVVSSGSYSDYGINFIVSSPNVITDKQFKEYHLESIRRSAAFDDRQNAKLAKLLNDNTIKSTNYYNIFPISSDKKPTISFEDWQRLCKDAGVEDNSYGWFEQVLKEQGCEIIEYEEFNTDDWD